MNKIIFCYVTLASILSSLLTRIWFDDSLRNSFQETASKIVRFLEEDAGKFIIEAFPLAPHWPLEKTVKAKENYASIQGGAKILETSTSTYYAKAILDDNPDTYMLISAAEEQKYFTLALTEDVLFEEIALVNKELFSSNVREFELHGSQSYPQVDWIYLGDFRFENSRNWQIFKVNPAWIRYIRLTIRSHYEEDKYICLTQVRIFGKTMLSEFKNDLSTEKIPQLNLSFPREDFKEIIKLQEKNILVPFQREAPNFYAQQMKPEHFVHTGNCTMKCEVDWILHGIFCEHSLTQLQENHTQPLLGPAEKPTRSNNSESYESVFRKLAKHIKILEENQQLLQKFMETQQKLNDYFDAETKSFASSIEEIKNHQTHLGNSLFSQSQEINKLRVSISRIEEAISQIKLENSVLNFVYKFSFIFIIASMLVIIFVNRFRKKRTLLTKKSLNQSFTSDRSLNKASSMIFKLDDISEISCSEQNFNSDVDLPPSNKKKRKRSKDNEKKIPIQRSKLMAFFNMLRSAKSESNN